MHTHQFFTWTTHTAENTTLLDYKKLYTYMCKIVTEFYLYSIVYIYLINSRLDVTHSVRHHFRTIQTLSNSRIHPPPMDNGIHLSKPQWIPIHGWWINPGIHRQRS